MQVMEFCDYGCDVTSGILQFNILGKRQEVILSLELY